MALNILHLADLHMDESKLSDIERRREALFKDLDKLKSHIGGGPDLVVFTGDLIYNGEKAKEEFDLAREKFIKPLLSHLSLAEDLFFLVPGNHEVDFSKISEPIETGFQPNFSSYEKFAEFFSSLKKHEKEFLLLKEKLRPYHDEKKKFRNKHLLRSDFFYDVYKIELGKIRIGILGLNSSWRCSKYGSDHDNGKLILGANIFEKAATEIEDCHIRIALAHHPFDMLASWDRTMMKAMMAQKINLFCTGHIHDSDFSNFNQMLGSLHVSTTGSLWQGRSQHGYSLLSCDVEKRTITAYLREWYLTRGEFDQETKKCEDGKVSFGNFLAKNEEINLLVGIQQIKTKILTNSTANKLIVNPLDQMREVGFEEVLVDPLISDTSNYERELKAVGQRYSYKTLVDSNSNLMFFGGKESGKTILAHMIKEYILKDDESHEGKLPIYVNFSDLPKNNVRGFLNLIKKAIDERCDEPQIERYLKEGHIVFILDDYGDFNDEDREKKKTVFLEFCKMYPKAQFVITAIETITQTFKQESLLLKESLKCKDYYLRPLNAAKIRELLQKWKGLQEFDADTMLDQILYYFKQLQIPVTPMAVTLFMGVLFRDASHKSIKNEAYLIENYLETILEKLQPEESSMEMDFKDKENFLAQFAKAMILTEKYEYEINEFEAFKLNYYNNLGEDIPNPKLFAAFFHKGILLESNRKISFSFKFWFHFFTAKAMQKDDAFKKHILNQKNYLKHAAALTYKAGLDRNDGALLKETDARLETALGEKKKLISGTDAASFQEILIDLSKDLEKEIREKNTHVEKDPVKDGEYLEKQEDEEVADDIASLITLVSDILRNTTEISFEEKKYFCKRNVAAYLDLMWCTLDDFKKFVAGQSEKELADLLKITDKNVSKEIITKINNFIYRIVPLSIAIYMADHLNASKLKRSFSSLFETEVDLPSKLFYALIELRIDLSDGLKHMREILKLSKSNVVDFIIYMFLRFYCHEKVVSEPLLSEIISVMASIREKNAPRKSDAPPFVKDTFRSDMLKELQEAKRRLLSKVE